MSHVKVETYKTHTPYSDPGPYANRLKNLPSKPEDIAAVARNVIVHYRGSGSKVDPANAADIDARWLAASLAIDDKRHGGKDLEEPRELPHRVQGCCRDHTLFCVGTLRQHGIPARSRVGWAKYLSKGFNHDHVIVEYHNGTRWKRFDPEWSSPTPGLPVPYDIPAGPNAPFVTAAEVWLAYRAGSIDPDLYGVAPGVPIGGPWMMQCYVLTELAHRYGDELLLWDAWGVMADCDGFEKARKEGPSDVGIKVADEIADLLVRADSGDENAEKELEERYMTDERIRPGSVVNRTSPRPGEKTVQDQVGVWRPSANESTT